MNNAHATMTAVRRVCVETRVMLGSIGIGAVLPGGLREGSFREPGVPRLPSGCGPFCEERCMFDWYTSLRPSGRRTFWACCGGYALDAMDVQIYSFVVPALIALWG